MKDGQDQSVIKLAVQELATEYKDAVTSEECEEN